MRVPKVRFLLLVAFLALICVAIILSGCARFDGIVDFTASPTSGKKPLTVQFTPAVEGSVRRYVWNFGDGQTSTERSPQHTYVDAGAYTVILMVDPRQGDPTSALKKDYITVTAAGFGGTSPQLTAEDDYFDLDLETPTYNQYGQLCYRLDVLANDVSPDPTAELTIVGISLYGYVEYDDFGREIDFDIYRLAIAGGGWTGESLELFPTKDLSHYLGTYSFFYLVDDGQSTAKARLDITKLDSSHPL